MVYLILAKVILPQEGVPFLILLQLFYTMGEKRPWHMAFEVYLVLGKQAIRDARWAFHLVLFFFLCYYKRDGLSGSFD